MVVEDRNTMEEASPAREVEDVKESAPQPANPLKVAIFPWGDPRNWRYVEYCSEEACVKGFSPLSLVASSPKTRPDLIIIYALDTLYDGDIFTDYKSLVEAVRSDVSKYLCIDKELDIRIEVLPGIMKRRVKDHEIEFRAVPSDTRLKALYHTYKNIFEKLEHDMEGRRLEILLDTTHGVNYFTMLVREAVFEAASMLAAQGREVNVKILNSDPFIVGDLPRRSSQDPCKPDRGEPVVKITYNLIHEVKILPWELTKYLRYSANSVRKVLTDINSCTINREELRRLTSFSIRTVTLYRVGALVELLSLSREKPQETHKLLCMADEALECWISKAKIIAEDNVLRTSFCKLQDGIRLLLHAHAIIQGFNRVINHDKSFTTLGEVKEARSKLLKGSEITSTLVDREIGLLENLKKSDKPLNDWTIYAETADYGEGVGCAEHLEDKDVNRVKRNFIAHAGFLNDFLEIRKGESDLEIRVRPGCRGIIDRVLEEKLWRDLLIS